MRNEETPSCPGATTRQRTMASASGTTVGQNAKGNAAVVRLAVRHNFKAGKSKRPNQNMITKISPIQRTILVLLQNRTLETNADIFTRAVLAAHFHSALDPYRPVPGKPCPTGNPLERYANDKGSVNRAVLDLEARGFISRVRGASNHWSRFSLTALGVETAQKLSTSTRYA